MQSNRIDRHATHQSHARYPLVCVRRLLKLGLPYSAAILTELCGLVISIVSKTLRKQEMDRTEKTYVYKHSRWVRAKRKQKEAIAFRTASHQPTPDLASAVWL